MTATDTVWAAGEREDIRAVRAWCLKELGLPKPQVQVFGYWRHGKTGTDADMARLTGIAALRDQGRELEDDFEIEIRAPATPAPGRSGSSARRGPGCDCPAPCCARGTSGWRRRPG
ncbi:SIP domain-containing protein [Corynebacterium variabile]|uniref:SIP domain-containing protein n=2 Tax=Corynebacterium variabile TaxID=1727 RepID=UPI002FDF6348